MIKVALNFILSCADYLDALVGRGDIKYPYIEAEYIHANGNYQLIRQVFHLPSNKYTLKKIVAITTRWNLLFSIPASITLM